MRRNAIAWVAVALSGAALVSSLDLTTSPLPAAPQISGEGRKEVQALSAAFKAVAEFTKPSVVQINTQGKAIRIGGGGGGRQMDPKDLEELLKRFPFRGPDGKPVDPKDAEEMLKRFRGLAPDGFDFEPQQFQQEGTGSGFVYDDQGHILTNNHVVEDSDTITVTFHDGETAEAKVVGRDPETDVAVIKVDRTDYRPLPRGDSTKLSAGEWVMAVGSPFGLSQTVTAGIVSATHRNDVQIIDQGYEDFIQTDASINPGNSGGPLVDMNGRVVGINSAIATATRSNAGVGFAIPIDLAGKLADQIIGKGKVTRARIGILMQPLTPSLARTLGLDAKIKGILVNQVVPGSPAEKAGIQSGDVLVGFDGESVGSVPAFRMDVATREVGQKFTMKYIREGEEQTAQVTLASADDVPVPVALRGRGERRARPEPEEAPKATVEGFGLEVQELTPDLADQLGYAKGTNGLLISSVANDSLAAKAGLEKGLLVTKVIVDKQPRDVADPDAFQKLIGAEDEVALYIQTPAGVGRYVPLSREVK